MTNNCWLLCITLLILSSACKEEKKQLAERPNIVLIMADDMGYADAGFMGSAIRTPNIDSLATNGLLMTNFYNNARCCPTRASLLTGLYPQQVGLGDMLFDMGYPAYRGYLNDQCVTIAEVLGQAGYSTYLSGKWHVGNEPGNRPTDRGFDRFFGFLMGGVYYWPFIRPRDVYLNDEVIEIDKESFYSTEAISDYGVQFVIEHLEQKKNPFFLYLPHIAPHFPLQAPEELIASYRGSFIAGFDSLREKSYNYMLASGILDSSVELSPPDQRVRNWANLSEGQKDTFDLKMSVYAAQIEMMDRGIGDLMAELRKRGELDNTIIMFFSDNGGSAADLPNDNTGSVPIGSRRSESIYGASWANVSNTPFRMYKHWTQEGGIITPLVVHWPEKIREGRIEHQRGHVMDLMPTLLDVAGLQYPTEFNGNDILPCEGKSMLPIINQQQRRVQDFLYWEHQGNAAIRHKQWKAVQQYPEKNWQLYNLATDRVEQHDLSEQFPDTLQLLVDNYRQWAQKVGVKPWDQLLLEGRPKTYYKTNKE